MSRFVHLHTHSHYSLLDGLGKIDELLDRAKELGMNAMALTDYGNLYGAVEWCVTAKDRGIKPIIGCEMYVTKDMRSQGNGPDDKRRYHITLLVENQTGYKNLLKLVTLSYLEGFNDKPRIDKETLALYHEGLIALSGCHEGEVPSMAKTGNVKKTKKIALEYQTIFGKDNFFLEIQDHPQSKDQKIINETLITLSKESDLPLVATADIHYIYPQDAPVQDILLCIQTNRKVYEKDRMNYMDYDLSLRSPEDMERIFAHVPDAIENTAKIADRCNFQIKLGETELPTYPLPEGETPDSYLRQLTLEGLSRHYKDDEITQEHRERMEYELDVIQKTGYSAYFLIVQDFINWARRQGIVVGPGRGSAAGSFVSYLVGITNIDPIKYHLLFERFLNPERVSMPDVDIDFADDRRDDVLIIVAKSMAKITLLILLPLELWPHEPLFVMREEHLVSLMIFVTKQPSLFLCFLLSVKHLKNVPDFKLLYDKNAEAKKLHSQCQALRGCVSTRFCSCLWYRYHPKTSF
jgi:DNA polymerase III subunit alpha